MTSQVISTMSSPRNECKDLTQLCCGALCMIAIICSVFAYIIMGLIILVEDYTVWHDCDNTSELWPYCLVAILLFWNKVAARNAINNEENNNDTAFIISTITCCILIELGLAIWGAVELFDESEKTCCTSNHSKNFVNGTCHELNTTPSVDIWSCNKHPFMDCHMRFPHFLSLLS